MPVDRILTRTSLVSESSGMGAPWAPVVAASQDHAYDRKRENTFLNILIYQYPNVNGKSSNVDRICMAIGTGVLRMTLTPFTRMPKWA